MKILILSGKQGSGKTSIQKQLSELWFKKYGVGIYNVNFADIIYEMHDSILSILHRYWPDRNLAKDGPLLQLLGTDWGRKTIDENIWVKALQAKLKRHAEISSENENSLVIIGDCRFYNEFDAFPSALRVRLECDEITRKARCSMWRENTQHASEIGLDEYARQGDFDMYLNTQDNPTAGCVSLLMVALEKNDWAKRRHENGYF